MATKLRTVEENLREVQEAERTCTDIEERSYLRDKERVLLEKQTLLL